MIAGVMSETYAPEKKPNRMATAMSPPGEPAPRTAKHRIPAPAHITDMRLSEPM
jgi:hypothetical protein